MLINCDTSLQESIQVAERRSLAELKVFLQRCIDVIQFLFFVQSDLNKQGRKLIDLMRSLDEDTLDALSKEEYRDFVTYDSNVIVRRLMERLTSLESTDDA